MAWIELHDTLPDHEKVIDCSSDLKIDKDLLVGKLVRLWVWALNNRESGYFREADIQTVAEVMRYSKSARLLVETMVNHRLLDKVDGGYVIHDWDEYVCMLLKKRETVRAQTRERVRKHREKTSENVTNSNALQERYETDECNASNAATVPYQVTTPPPSEGKRARARRRFIPPTEQEVADYCHENGYAVDAARFWKYYDAAKWHDKDGKPVLNWKQRVITWAGREADRRKPAVGQHGYAEHEFSKAELDALLVDLDGDL